MGCQLTGGLNESFAEADPHCEVAPCLHSFKRNPALPAHRCCGYSPSLGTCGLVAADEETVCL